MKVKQPHTNRSSFRTYDDTQIDIAVKFITTLF